MASELPKAEVVAGDGDPGHLRRSLTLFDVTALGINGVIGTGIFLVLGKTTGLLGPASLLPMLFAAGLAFLIALCFAEVGSYFRGTGGAYLYALRTYGDGVGFLVGWMTCVVTVVAWAALANGLTTQVALYVPALKGGLPRALFLVAFMGVLTVLNLRGAKLGARISNFFTAAKLIPLLLFVGVGLFFVDTAQFTPFAPNGYGDFFTTTLLIFYAFVGFESSVVPAGEMENPRRAVPISLVIVLATVTVIYVGVQVVATGTLPELAGHDAPVAAASERFLGSYGSAIVAGGIVVSMIGINAASALVGPRRLFALAENGHLPRKLTELSRFGTPWASILLLYIVACGLAIGGSFETLALISVVGRFAQYLATCAAVLVLRYRGPLGEGSKEAGFKLPLGPTIPVLALGIGVWVLANSAREKLIAGGIALGAGAVIYLTVRMLRGPRR